MSNELPENVEIDEDAEIFQRITIDHTILEIWDNILESGQKEEELPVTFAVANHVVRSWPTLKYSDVPLYQGLFYSHLSELRSLLKTRIAEDISRLEHAQDDAEWNKDVYLDISLDWNEYFEGVERAWDCMSETAAVEVAALSEAANFTITERGLLGYLAQIGVEYEEADVTAAQLRRKNEED